VAEKRDEYLRRAQNNTRVQWAVRRKMLVSWLEADRKVPGCVDPLNVHTGSRRHTRVRLAVEEAVRTDDYELVRLLFARSIERRSSRGQNEHQTARKRTETSETRKRVETGLAAAEQLATRLRKFASSTRMLEVLRESGALSGTADDGPTLLRVLQTTTDGSGSDSLNLLRYHVLEGGMSIDTKVHLPPHPRTVFGCFMHGMSPLPSSFFLKSWWKVPKYQHGDIDVHAIVRELVELGASATDADLLESDGCGSATVSVVECALTSVRERHRTVLGWLAELGNNLIPDLRVIVLDYYDASPTQIVRHLAHIRSLHPRGA